MKVTIRVRVSVRVRVIAVIAPYAAQVSLLSSTLAAAAAGSVEVATVDS